MTNIRKYDIQMLETIQEGVADIYEISEQYIHTSPATGLKIVEIQPPHFLVDDEKGNEIIHEISSINTDSLILYMPLSFQVKVCSLKVRYCLGLGSAYDVPDQLFRYLEFDEIIKANFIHYNDEKEEKKIVELRSYSTII